jgi:hypothetical protein
MEINFRTENGQKMALKSIKRLILSIDGASLIGFVRVQTPF